ncbi:hypothetical protein EVAR_98237_1 [Eumeta japonica]|uniref:Uncharacterized protein n=1 Tax=Eumeta variegata TaxID=151549 RepID=A0A4C1XZU8_EUMVA|nr:hypothetical protein EVAR_98237_1 [Eumeta japonica]
MAHGFRRLTRTRDPSTDLRHQALVIALPCTLLPLLRQCDCKAVYPVNGICDRTEGPVDCRQENVGGAHAGRATTGQPRATDVRENRSLTVGPEKEIPEMLHCRNANSVEVLTRAERGTRSRGNEGEAAFTSLSDSLFIFPFQNSTVERFHPTERPGRSRRPNAGRLTILEYDERRRKLPTRRVVSEARNV